MATNSQGIVIPISAKIEGWQNSIKEIQSAMKKLDLGTDLGKNLEKSLSIVIKQVENMSKNVNQRFTSEGAINGFYDKINGIDEAFASLGTTLHSVKFEELDTSYVTESFKELINQINQAKEALNTGLEQGFQNALSGTQYIQKALDRLNIDPSKLNMAEIKTALETASVQLTEDIAKVNEELDETRNKVRELKAESAKIQSTGEYKIVDPTEMAKSLVGTMSAQDFGLTSRFQGTLQEIKQTVETGLQTVGKITDEKKAEINEKLNQLVSSSSVTEARQRITELRAEFEQLKIIGDTGFTTTNVRNWSTQLTQNLFDEQQFESAINTIKEKLTNLNFSEEIVNKIVAGLTPETIKQHFDQIPTLLAESLEAAKNEATNAVNTIAEQMGTLGEKIKTLMSTQGVQTATKYAADQGLKEYDTVIAKLQEENKELSDRVKALETSLKEQATGSVTNTGNKVINSSRESLEENTKAANEYKTALDQVKSAEQMIGKIQGVVQRWFSIYSAVRMVGKAIRSVIATTQELDKTITEIAIVTDMDQGELWKQMPQYTAMAKEYAASISGVYEVSQLYYQQGLETADVMALTEQTLKMARISGLDYAEATNYMTNALRSFKMEMTEAQTIVDVYSAIAASSATDTTELASAMSKTASSAEAVGSSFENTTAMMAVMIEATRESAENIGSAMKSIISRYGEMTSDPSKLVDSEGQEMSLNRVDKALQTVGITIHDTAGEFRDFDDVIMELASKWDTIDKNTQRYIATIMAGNRQQSRFLALVSSYDRLKELSETAANSEDASQLQFLKTLDSIEAKTQQFQTSMQSLYTDAGIENLYKGILDYGTKIIDTWTDMPRVFNLPIPAIINMGTTFANLATIVTTVFGIIKARVAANIAAITAQEKIGSMQRVNNAIEEGQERVGISYNTAEQIAEADAKITENAQAQSAARLSTWSEEAAGRISSATNATKTSSKLFQGLTQKSALKGLGLQAGGLFLSGLSSSLNKGTLKGTLGIAGNVASYAGMAFSMTANPYIAAAAGAAGLITGIIENINNFYESSEAKLKRLKEEANEANNERIKANAEYNDAKSEIDSLAELEKARYDSTEAAEAYFEVSNRIAETYPQLVSAYDSEGNAIIDLAASYKVLEEARLKAQGAAIKSAGKAYEVAAESQKQAETNYANKENKTYSDIFYINDYLHTTDQGQAFRHNSVLNNENNGEQSFFDYYIDAYGSEGSLVDWIRYAAADLQNVLGENSDFSDLVNNLKSGNQFEAIQILKDQDKLEKMIDWSKTIVDPVEQELVKWILSLGQDFSDSMNTSKEKGEVLQAAEETRLRALSGIATVTNTYTQEYLLAAQFNKRQSADFLKEFTPVNEIINGVIYQEWENTKGQFSSFEQFLNADTTAKKYSDLYDELSDFWDNLFPDEQINLNNLIANNGAYTKGNFIEKIKEILDITGELPEFLNKWIDTTFEDVYSFEDFEKAINNKEITLDINKVKDLDLGGEELRNLLSVYTQLDKQIKGHQLTGQAAQDIIDAYIRLYNLTEGDEDAQKLITEADIFTLSGLDALQKGLLELGYGENKSDEVIKKVQELYGIIPTNLTTEIQTILKNYTDQIDDFEKSVSNISKGMNYKTAMQEAEKLGGNISELFDWKDGKYYIKDYVQAYNTLIDNSSVGLAELTNTIEKEREYAKSKHVSDGLISILSESGAQTYFGIGKEELTKQHEEYLASIEEGVTQSTTSFVDWYFDKQIATAKSELDTGEQYAKDMFARAALENGQINQFISLLFGDNFDYVDAVKEAILSGDVSSIDGLTPEQKALISQYQSAVEKMFKDVYSSIADSMISAVGGGNKKITITETNIDAIKKLGKDHSEWFEGYINFDNLKVGNTVSLSAEQLAKDSEGFIQWLNTEIKDESERLKKYQEYYKNSYSNKAIASFTKIADKDSFSLEDFQQYLQTVHNASNDYVIENWQAAAKSMGLSVNAMGQLIITDYDKWAKELEWATSIIKSDDNVSIEEINKARTILANAKTVKDQTERTAVEDVVKNYTAVTNAQKEALANALHIDVKDLESYFKLNDDGITSTFDLNAFQQAIKDGTISIGDSAFNLFFSIVKNMADGILDSINKAGSYISEGTTNFTEMQAFTDEYNNLFEQDLSTAFNYNEILQAWTLNPIVYQNYLRKQIDDLVASGNMTVHQALDYTRKELSSKIDIASYVGSGRNSFNTESIKQTMIAFNTTFSLYTKELEQAEKDYQKQLDETVFQGKKKKIDISSIEQAKKKVQDIQDQIVTDATQKAESDLESLLEGGEEAVKIYKEYTDDSEETFENIQAVYLNKLNRYQNTISNLEGLQVGSTVDEQTAETLNELQAFGFKVDNKGVVQAVGKMEKAYQQLYFKMKQTTLATTSQLNSVYAQYLTAEEQPEIDAISALGDAMGMTYDSLGSLLANYGASLEEVANNWSKYGISQIGNGKIRIDDFTTFANQIGLEGNTGEYVTAFKAYNDSLIALDRETNKAIVDEINSIVSAKPGERINLTYLQSFIDKNLTESAAEALYKQLEAAGITFNNGIATIAENANIEGAIESIVRQSEINALMLPDELAALKDAVDSLLTNMISLIKNGISGTLSNADANSLREFAKRLNIDIDFTETAEGLKLSTASAMKLYLQLKQIDKLQAQSLLPDIASMSDNYSSLQKACARYNQLIKTNTDSLQDEKEVLDDLVKSMLTTPDSFNFMSGSLPDSWQSSLNFLSNMEDARTKLQAASKAGYMDVTDFYNIVSAAGAYNADFSLNGMNANQLLAAASNHIITKNGSQVIDLSAKTGLNLGKNGYSSLYEQLRSGAEYITQQSEAYYEIGERLQVISSYLNNGEELDISNVSKLASQIPELKLAFENVSIGTKDLSSLLQSNDLDPAQATKFKDFFSKITQIDWNDPTKYASQINDLFKNGGMDITIDTGDYSFIHVNPSGNVLKIDLTDQQLRSAVVKEYNKLFGENGKKNASQKNITETLEELSKQYETEARIPQKIKIRRVLSIAEGKFDPSNFKYDDKSKTWSYTYNGKTYTSSGTDKNKSKEELSNQITKAIMLEDEGFTIDVTDTVNIKGTQKIGNISIEVQWNEDSKTYKVPGYNGSFDSYQAALNYCIDNGFVSSELEGKYTIDGKQHNVIVDSTTGITFTRTFEEGKEHNKIDGKDFGENRAALHQYLALKFKYPEAEITLDENENATLKVDDNTFIDIIFDSKGNIRSIIYDVDGMKLDNEEAYNAWLAAKAKQSIGENGEPDIKTITDHEGKIISKTITFSQEGVEVELTIDTNGNVTYTFTDAATGDVFTANSQADYEQALAGYAALHGKTLSATDGEGYTIKSGKFKILVQTNGEIEVQDEKGNTVDPSNYTENIRDKVEALKGATIPATETVTITAEDQASSIIKGVQDNLIKLAQRTYTATVKAKVNYSEAKGNIPQIDKPGNTNPKSRVNLVQAKGNVALAAGTQSTLMGELGPELWVSDGHYYIAGRNGAEFVDLPKDAIVFNHLQTARLLGTGASGRGKPITSEYAAVALARGSWNGGFAAATSEHFKGSNKGSSDGTKVTLSDDAKSKLSSLISDALSKGFENLDWSDYEKELGSMMDEIKNTARINYRAFIDAYAGQCDKTTSEINELYFQAWQKDLEDSMDSEDIVSAAEGLSFYGNGSIGGSSSDWLSIIGDRARITDLVEQGIMSYDAATKQYFVTNAEALASAGVDISQIEGIQEMIYDSLRSQYDQIVDYISNGLEGSLTAMDSKSLQSLVERMGITDLQLDFEQTVNGLKLSQESAISLYNELKKVDSIAAQLTFNELVENLQESNDDYKTMTSLLTHIYDLTDKISQTDKYSDTKIKQYQEELSLAKQIAAVRATTDEESFSWYDEELPAGMNNPLNYISSWQDSIEMLRNASESGVADFKGMVNTAKQINAQAKALNTTLSFCGYELDGSTEALDAIITAMAGSLGAVTTDSGTNFGVVLEKMGADITDGASSYENSATSAMQTMAQAQIQILDGLIATFEMLAALEGLEKIDLNLDKKIDLEELFDLTADVGDLGVKLQDNAATAIDSILEANDEIAEQLKTVTYGSYTLYDLFKDASDGYLNAEIAKEDFLKLVQALYELALGDYDKNDIAGSLYDKLATLDLTQTLTLGDYTINVKYSDYKVTQTDDGKWKTTTKGTPWDTFDEAVRAEALEKAGVTGTITWSEDKVTASGALSFKSVEMTVVADAEGVHYNYNGVQYNSLNDAAAAAWNAAGGEQGTQLTLDEWKIQQGITVVTTVSKVDTSNISKSQIDKLVGTSWQEIKAKWDAAAGDKEAQQQFQIEYGFTLDNKTTEADFNEMKKRLGITENRMELTLAITNLDEIAAEFASKMTNITLNPTSADATGSATVTADTTEAVTSIGAVEEAINKAIKAIEYLNTLKVAIDKGTAEADMQAIETATKDAEKAVGNLDTAVSGLTTQFGYLNGTLSTLQTYLSGLSNSTISIQATGHEVLETIAQNLRSIQTDIASLKTQEVEGKIVLNITTGGEVKATGNVIGNGAFAAGSRQVLMGELGPELYVTGGRYYVAGQSGAEFVNLPNDAIVFNHLQTRKLLSTGAAGRGKPVTNEKAATSLATGNAMGLAMANVQQTLATLKQLRAMWQSIANASITDMVGLANMKDTESSSDGGSSKIDRKAWIETLEKWYNWLQKIAELEKEINYEEQLRNTLETRQGPKGKELYESQKRELEMIKQQYAVQKSLVDSRREYFEARRAQLNSSVFGKFYQFDEHGQQFYTRGTKFEFGKTADYVAAQKAAQANGGNGATTTTMTNVAPEMTKHTAEWNKSIENLALAIYNNRAQNQWSRLSDGSISSRIHHYETMDQALKWAQTLYRIDENGKATYLGNPTAKGDPLAYSDVAGRLWDIWVKNIGVDFDRLQSGEKQRSNMDQNALNASSEYKKLLSQTIQDTAKAVGQEVGGGSTGGGAAGANPPRSELAQITQIEGGFAALMELWARDPQTLEPKYTPAEQYAIAQSLGFGNYMLYDQSGNKIEPGENGQDDTFYTSALQALTDNLDADREEMQSLYDSIEEDEKKLLELEQKQNEILLAIRDNQIDVENKILDAIEAREQAIIDELSDTKEVLEDNADKYINGLNEALSNEQRMYQSNKSQNELESLRRQLAILQRSGGSASQINSLQQQIDAKEQENYFDAQQQQIDAIQAASDLEIERLDKQIEIMETTLEYSKEHGLLWAEVSQIMQQDDGVIMDFLLSNTAEYLASSTLQQSATYDELLSMVNQWTAYRDDQNKYRPLQEDMEVGLEDIMANIFSTDANVEDSNVISAIVGANVQVAQGMQAVAAATGATALSGTGSNSTAGTGTTSSSGSVKGSGSTATSAYANWLNGMGDALGTTANWMTAIQSYYKGDSSKSMAAQTGALAQEHYDKAASQPGSTAAKTWVASNDYVYDKSTTQLEKYANWNLKNIEKDLEDINNPNGKYKDMPEDWKKNKINVYTEVLRQNGVQGYSSGGSVDYTGLAMVHGTPTRPEYFLDAEETKMWKSDILSANSSSLTSRLLALREILNGIESASSHINNSTDNGVIIEKAEVNVDVAQLANDYDARRAGDTIMDEILQIARKTGVSSVRR